MKNEELERRIDEIEKTLAAHEGAAKERIKNRAKLEKKRDRRDKRITIILSVIAILITLIGLVASLKAFGG